MILDPGKVLRSWKLVFERRVLEMRKNGILKDQAERLRDIRACHGNACRRVMQGDPEARVKPMSGKIKPGTEATNVRPRWSDVTRNTCLAGHMVALAPFGSVLSEL